MPDGRSGSIASAAHLIRLASGYIATENTADGSRPLLLTHRQKGVGAAASIRASTRGYAEIAVTPLGG
ncbi:hypothetical protein AB0I99_04565, partial [Streptomyces spongiicola]|uniref:hypothetical protein n=1 Tax=Streptomyces spongiicola TaxID=1690221 RepID=UPI00340C9348